MQLRGRRFDTGQSVAIQVSGDRITDVSPVETQDSLPWIAPGFVDLQVNGYVAQSFNDRQLTPQRVVKNAQHMAQSGVCRYCPTVITDSHDVLVHAVRTIGEACDTIPQVNDQVIGIHQEGPYLSREDGPRGAHALEHCRPPDWDEFQAIQEAAGGRICILTLSPEYEGSTEFIRRVVASGVLVAIGHTAATADQIRKAVDAGARLSTHLGNGAHAQIHRHRSYIWSQLSDDRLCASLIVDGHHLPGEVVQTFVRAKTPERCVLVSDVSPMGGMPPGRYTAFGLGEVEVLKSGRLVVAGQHEVMAGASFLMDVCVAKVMRLAGVDLETAVHMASTWPAELVGQDAVSLEPGSRADLVLFDLPGADRPRSVDTLTVKRTVVAGNVVFNNC